MSLQELEPYKKIGVILWTTEPAKLVLYIVKLPVETVSDCTYCRQSHGDISRRRGVCSMLVVKSVLFLHLLNWLSGRILPNMSSLLRHVASYVHPRSHQRIDISAYFDMRVVDTVDSQKLEDCYINHG
jgi:hypothetical protein